MCSRFEKEKWSVRMRIVVVGLGKVGRALTAQLTAENNDIVVIDQNP